jgi:hypothetical protein
VIGPDVSRTYRVVMFLLVGWILQRNLVLRLRHEHFAQLISMPHLVNHEQKRLQKVPIALEYIRGAEPELMSTTIPTDVEFMLTKIPVSQRYVEGRSINKHLALPLTTGFHF